MWKWPSSSKEGYEFIMIGHKGHPEVEGTMGQLTEGIYLVDARGRCGSSVQAASPPSSPW